MAWFDRPPASIKKDLKLAAGQRIHDALHCGGARPVIGCGRPGVEGTLQPGQVAERDACRGLAGSLRRDQPAEQRGHQLALVGEDPDVALRAGQQERLGEGRDRACFIAGDRPRQRQQRADLDEAASPVLTGRRFVQPVQQHQRPAGPVLGLQRSFLCC
jgi:hypothetical protein